MSECSSAACHKAAKDLFSWFGLDNSTRPLALGGKLSLSLQPLVALLAHSLADINTNINTTNHFFNNICMDLLILDTLLRIIINLYYK